MEERALVSLVGRRYGCEFVIASVGPPSESGRAEDRTAMLFVRGTPYLLNVAELVTLVESGLLERRS